ncbi:ribonucleases P/MRP protein subunit POP1-like [Vespa mandarinia]|uniref:ribonucleases P/MRP protein subunit POP1-like n=1 Tax=Vespa mandarinia TaxID=7446 RepID=UPI0016147E58|nr:ribonucleases P/MRP protein subunit POP1-like [Vespa mandarinia]
MENKEQFDIFLGGTQSLPYDVSIMKLAAARASEIAAMTHAIENPQQSKLVFQKLPIHMRRRVMSHNVKRLPRRLREAHLNQMIKSGLPPKNKRPSRKYRRRPSNLLLEYNRRQRKKAWLETHIWHAKRFHMVEQWGYRIADFANDKCFKANYRAIRKHCLIQDLSYYACIEIIGPENILKETLKSHCNPNELTFGAKVYINGTREGTLMFFKKNSFPLFPIGNVHFLWKSDNCDQRTIWIWVHPAFYDDILFDIMSSFKFNSCIIEDEGSTSFNQLQNSYSNESNCRLNLLKGTLNRFRLCGPLTLDVLTNTFKLPNIKQNLSTIIESKMDCDDVTEDKKDSLDIKDTWYKDYYSDQKNFKTFKIQEKLWQTLQSLNSPHQLPRNMVLGFTVLDPRFYLPEKRTKPQKQVTDSETITMPLADSNDSPIWDKNMRQKISKSYLSNIIINKLRSNNLVPGVSNDNQFNEDVIAKIPILVIQKPGNCNTGLASGIDIIIPSGWAMAFWLGFIYRCTRVGALRETKSIVFETAITNSPDINEPDTLAYNREALSTKEYWKEKYFRYPPNRRVNFIKLGISSPFFCEWHILMKEWSGMNDFYVLRNRTTLIQLQTNLSSFELKKSKNKRKIPASKITLDNALNNENCLIRVRISILNKGNPKMFAIICAPTDEDLERLKHDKRWSGPVEKINKDPNESLRKMLRKNHLLLLKRYRRQRIRHKKALEKTISDAFEENANKVNYNIEIRNLRQNLLKKSRKVVLEHSYKMSKLYLPDCTEVRNSCKREIMGYITLGNFSFSEAKGIGIGYVTIQSVIAMIARESNIVLIRNNRSRQYRAARLEILFN